MKFIVPKTEDGIIHNYHADTCFKYNGWPSVCCDDRGVLYAVASSMRMSHVDPTGKNCMWVSFNEGKTWSCPIVVNDSYFDDRDTGIVYLGNGKMLLSWFSLCYADFCDGIQDYDWFDERDKCISAGFSAMWKKLPEEVRKAGNGAFVKTSDDYGMTWSDPIRVPVTAPHGPSLCKDGSIVYMGKQMLDDYLAGDKIVVYTSHDDGKTWEYTGTVPEGKDITYKNMHEPHVVELPNGRLLGAIRAHERGIDPDNTIYVTHSDDKGKTWSVPEILDQSTDGLPPHLLVHSSGAVICSYACRTDGKRAERCVVSYDGGETWTEDYLINDRKNPNQNDLGYPASVEMPDGSIMTVFYQTLPGQWWTSILYTRWRLEEK